MFRILGGLVVIWAISRRDRCRWDERLTADRCRSELQRQRWQMSVCVSVPTTIILHTIWHDWPLDARDLGPLAFLVVHALGGVSRWAWGLQGLRESEAMDCQWRVQGVRWRAQRRAWRQEGDEQEPLRAE